MTQPRLTLNEVKNIVDDIKYPGKSFRLGETGEEIFLQVVYEEECTVTGEVEMQFARKWKVSRYSTETEIVETAYAALKRSALHQVGEWLTYKGRRIYSPHLDVNARLEMCDTYELDGREKL